MHDGMLSRFDTIPERDRQTDGRMDRRTDRQNCNVMLTRDKNWGFLGGRKARVGVAACRD